MSDLSIIAARRMYGGGNEADMLHAMASQRSYQRIYKYAQAPGEHRKLYKGCLESHAPPPEGDRYHEVLLVYDDGVVLDLEADSLWSEADGEWAKTWGSQIPSVERRHVPGEAGPADPSLPEWMLPTGLVLTGLGLAVLAVGYFIL